MKTRLVWFAAGSVTGLYASIKAKRAAYRLSPSGLIDQAGALGVGWREFSAELRDGMAARERQIAHDLALPPPPHERTTHLNPELNAKDKH